MSSPNPIKIVPQSQFQGTFQAGHYFMGGIFALMQAARLLQRDPHAIVTYVNDAGLKKSTQSAHQGHVHPTEWTTPELGTWQLAKVILSTFHLWPPSSPEDVQGYSYVHFPLKNMQLGLFARNVAFRVIHTLFSKHGVSDDDRWQCEAVRASLAFHKALNDEIEASGGKPYFSSRGRLIWSSDPQGIVRKQKLWTELGIETELVSREALTKQSLLKEDVPVYALNVVGDGKFFADAELSIIDHLRKKYPNNFQARIAQVSEVYVDDITNKPLGVKEVLPDGHHELVLCDSFLGSTGHNQVFKAGSQKPLWNEVSVTGVSTLWVCICPKNDLTHRFGIDQDIELIAHIKQLAGTANLTNLHMTIWDACIEDDQVHITLRVTQGANFNSDQADPNDLNNMKVNIDRFFIGSWKLLKASDCSRKTTTANIPKLSSHFVHGLSGIGYSFSAAPLEMLTRRAPPTTFRTRLWQALRNTFKW